MKTKIVDMAARGNVGIAVLKNNIAVGEGGNCRLLAVYHLFSQFFRKHNKLHRFIRAS